MLLVGWSAIDITTLRHDDRKHDFENDIAIFFQKKKVVSKPTTKFREEMHKQLFVSRRYGGIKFGSQP